MDKNNVSIATISWARDSQEEVLLRKSVQHLAALEVPVFITDGGSGPEFLTFLHSFPHFTVLEGRGLWQQAKTSMTEASSSGAQFVFYTEPDKLCFFRQWLTLMLNEVAADEETGIVLASRSTSAMSTFPPFQQITEATINQCCSEIIGGRFDYTYGPFLMNSRLVPYLQDLPEDIGWGWRPYAFGIAHRKQYKVAAYIGDFYCPEEQGSDNASERIYRMRQLTQNIQGLLLSHVV